VTVGDGKFVLYPNITPVLTAGDYRFTTTQTLSTTTGPSGAYDSGDLPIDTLDTHVRVRSPRYFLPPDQVLSTYPPANTEGSYGMRLPQIVIKRRTLPWERELVAGRPDVPWMALVLIAEGEAELKLNQPVAECVSPDRPLLGVADAERGNYLSISKSRIDALFPTQKDVRLLAHVRQVDIDDTELMLGDDDGFLAVVISNRLPLPGTDAAGGEVPVKYLACLVNLEGQFDRLRPEAPSRRTTYYPQVLDRVFMTAVDHDRATMQLESNVAIVGELGIHAELAEPRYQIGATQRVLDSATTNLSSTATTSVNSWSTVKGVSSSDVYTSMASGFENAIVHALDPVHRFPVLLHWSFTSVGSTTFRTLMEGLDSGLLGTVPAPDAAADDGPPAAGRPPLELVETGHVGLPHRNRRGDDVRCWYRGPFIAHPTTDQTAPDAERLALAHAADQLRIVVPDGREDLSLSSAFEIGRLLALARPSVTAALLRWRQDAYRIALQRTVFGDIDATHFGGLLGELDPGYTIGGASVFKPLIDAIVGSPELVVGSPSLLVKPGRAIKGLDGDISRTIERGFGLRAGTLKGPAATVLETLASTPVATAAPKSTIVDQHVAARLDDALLTLVRDTLSNQIDVVRRGRTTRVTITKARRRRDALDRLIADRKDPS
jgi:hypothetical protein